MRIKVLASGSKGNSTYIECGKVKLLIDAGVNYTKIKKELETINVSPEDLDLIVITHIHSDHIKGLDTLLKKTNINVYLPIEVCNELSKKIKLKNYHIVDKFFSYKNIEFELIPLSHDVDCFSYIITYQDKTVVYITDTGYLNRKNYDTIKNKDVYIIEANHNESMLMNGPYPYILKQRIISDKGHLSNSTTGKILSKVIGNKTKYIYLAHLSETNNTKELAFKEVTEQINKKFNIENVIITDQEISTELLEV